MDFCAASWLSLVFLAVGFSFMGFAMSRYPNEYVAVLRCPNRDCDHPLEAPSISNQRYAAILKPRDAGAHKLLCPYCGHIFPVHAQEGEEDKAAKLSVGRGRLLRWEWKD